MFINYIFHFNKETKIANFTHNNTPDLIERKMESLMKKLETDNSTLNGCFACDHLKYNAGECSFCDNRETCLQE